MTTTADVVVIGGGVVGLAAARCVARRHPGSKVVVLEKERAVGAHASGRNSGVLRALPFAEHLADEVEAAA